jgi:hypothetical protein
MKVMRFAAGFAAGYVLGSRAGREKYEQIVSAVGRVRDAGSGALASKPADDDTRDTQPSTPAVDTVPAVVESAPAVDPDPALDQVFAMDPLPAGASVPAVDPLTPVDPAPTVDAVPKPPRKRTKGTVTPPSVTADEPQDYEVP